MADDVNMEPEEHDNDTGFYKAAKSSQEQRELQTEPDLQEESLRAAQKRQLKLLGSIKRYNLCWLTVNLKLLNLK